MSIKLSNNIFNTLVKDSDMPETVRSQLFVGTKCNYQCKFCYYTPYLSVKNNPNEVYQQMRFVKNKGIQDIEFTGGEPTIDPQWFNYLIEGKKLFRHLSVITNGQKMAKREFIEKCYKLGLREILFSLHGFDKNSHEKITGISGSWEKILSAIGHAKDIGFLVRINCTVCSVNYLNLDKFALRIKEIKPLCLNLIPLNYWDGAEESGVDIPYYKMAPYIKYAIDLVKGHVRYINVRYMPYCHMEGYEEHLCNWHQHTYDYWDWSNSFKQLPKQEYREAREYVDEIRTHLYGKVTECLACKYRGICDGVEKKLISYNKLRTVPGDLIQDAMYFRKTYCSLEEYNQIIYDKN